MHRNTHKHIQQHWVKEQETLEHIKYQRLISEIKKMYPQGRIEDTLWEREREEEEEKEKPTPKRNLI